MQTLQGIIRKGMNNATTQMERLGYVANNLANYNTNAYKSMSFEQVMNEDGMLTGAVRVDQKVGMTRTTGNVLDVAITGQGYIPVVSEEGDVAYTRHGNLKIGKDGYLMTHDNWIVGEGIQIPANYDSLTINKNGEVMLKDAPESLERKLGTIPLVNFASSESLTNFGMNKFKPTEDSGEAKLIKNPECIAQYSIETSNTDMYGSLSDILRINASMLASTQMMKTVNDMYSKAISIRE